MGLGTNTTGVISNEEAMFLSKKCKGAEGANVLKCDTDEDIKALSKSKCTPLREILFPMPLATVNIIKIFV